MTGAMMSQVKSLFGPRPKVTLAPTAREKYFSVISAIRALRMLAQRFARVDLMSSDPYVHLACSFIAWRGA